jgi:hypothetical protein
MSIVVRQRMWNERIEVNRSEVFSFEVEDKLPREPRVCLKIDVRR